MQQTIVIAFSSLDGIIEDPDGSGGTASGGWAFRHGPEAVAGDKFRLGPVLDSGVLRAGPADLGAVLPHLAHPDRRVLHRHEPHPQAGRLPHPRRRQRLGQLPGDRRGLLVTVKEQVRDRDVVVAGSASVVHALAEADLVDEYRILLFSRPRWERVPDSSAASAPTHLRLLSADTAGQAVLLRYERQAS